MLKNYIKSAWRSLLRQKGYALINVAGLTLGLACCLLIFQYVAFEYSFDRFHENESDIYRVLQSLPLTGEAVEPGGAFTSYGLGPALEESVPEILHVARVQPEYSAAVVSSPAYPQRVFEEERAFYADADFLKIFTFPLLTGDVERALERGTVLISESTAQKYFGPANPIGQVLDVTGQVEESYRVVGVFADVPANSHLQFDFLLPMDNLVPDGYEDEPEPGWSWNNFITYVQLHPGADRAVVHRKMAEVYTARRGEALREQARTAHLWTQPLGDIHLNADISSPRAVMGSYRTVYFFTLIGLVTLLIALVNYVNLATARALDRAREVGVRKAIGAQRKQLVVQFLFESALTNMTAAVLAVAMAAMLTPLVNHLTDARLSGALWLNPGFWAAFLITLGAATLLAGLYPAFVLSSFKPITALKGKARAFPRQLWLRRGLVVLQFTASVVLVGGTVVVNRQLGYMRQMDLGLDLERVITVKGPLVLAEGTDRTAAMGTFLQELRRLPDVAQVATSSSLPGRGFNWNGASVRRAEDDPASVIRSVATYIDSSFASLYGLEKVAGAEFDMTSQVEADGPWLVMANETAVRSLGFESPAAAVDHTLDIGGYEARILGVYRDFNWSSAHEPRQNIFFGRTDGGLYISLRVSAANLSRTIDSIESTYARLFPGNVFNYQFADEAFEAQYRNEERFATLFAFFAALAIAIACFGLFGLASFTAQQRTKEIGVRKVLGASVSSIIALLSSNFALLVGIAFVVATPTAYFIMHNWLQGFAYRVELGPGVFLLAGVLVILIAGLSVGYQAVRAATADPVKSLRYE